MVLGDVSRYHKHTCKAHVRYLYMCVGLSGGPSCLLGRSAFHGFLLSSDGGGEFFKEFKSGAA